ncbi:putative pectinesterase A [Pseudocercospora fuligena]|uniref:pectinesterase n=1 Tax=Pseudocercospora fuligena TaxID=685502 RepID=A0A8H6RI83_9PEZI|nr:putative pectinesterase A [Pseudocercospora fuligena]
MLLHHPSSLLPILLLSLSHSAFSLASYDRAECQYPSQDPLQGCPPNTILVGHNTGFSSIQAAIFSINDTEAPYTILIQPNNYTEQVNITRSAPLTLLGVTQHPNDATKNAVNIIWHNATGTNTTGSYDNAYTSTLTVSPTLNASLTGSGPTGNSVPEGTPFGNADFRAYNLNFWNKYLPYSAGPSLATGISYANAGFYFCGVGSWQDTVYVGKLGSVYMYGSIVAGQTDFLYGFGTLWIEKSRLLLRSCGGGVTAWKGTNTTFENKYGVYIHDSDVVKANSSLEIRHKCALGRPWNAQHRSIFSGCYLDDSILPAGYIEWSASDPRVNYSEYSMDDDAAAAAACTDCGARYNDGRIS